MIDNQKLTTCHHKLFFLKVHHSIFV